jgi:hypothetical protein
MQWGIPLTAGAIAAAGFLPWKQGRLWDVYLGGIRRFEEFSPGGIFRTLQISDVLAPLSSTDKFALGSDWFKEGTAIQQTARKHLTARMLGMDAGELEKLGAFEHGVEMSRPKGLFGPKTFGELRVAGGEKALLSNAAIPIKLESHGGSSFAGWLSTVRGLEEKTLKASALEEAGHVPYIFMAAGQPVKKVFAKAGSPGLERIIGKAAVAADYARGYAAMNIGRLDNLLRGALEELPLVGKTLADRLGQLADSGAIPIKLGIKRGTATRMLGRYAVKGLAVYGAYEGIRYLSYLRRTSDSSIASGVVGTGIGAAVGGLLWRGRFQRAGLIGGAITGAILGAAPLFKQGIGEGFATAWTRAHVGYAGAAEKFGLTESGKRQEDLMPGVTRVTSLAGLGLAGVLTGAAAGTVQRWRYLRAIGKEIGDPARTFNEFNLRKAALEAKIGESVVHGEGKALSGLRRYFWPGIEELAGRKGFGKRVLMRGGRMGLGLGVATYAALATGSAIATGSYMPSLMGAAAGALAGGWLKGGKGALVGAIAGMFAGGATGSLLAPKYTQEEWKKVYTGEQEVPVRKGRWWSFGRSAWQGGRISYFRPHWYALMMSKARTKGLWDTEEDYWKYNPLIHPLKALFSDKFKYAWEIKHYWDRPYPASGTYGEEIPFLGPAASAVGQMIKPPLLMHTEEWMNPPPAGPGAGGLFPGGAPGFETGGPGAAGPEQQYKHIPGMSNPEAAFELGGYQRGAPASPFTGRFRVGEFIYRMNELRGFPGFLHNALKGTFTGSEDYFDQQEMLQTSSRATGLERAYWDKELGDFAGLNEAFRRFLPHRRRQIEEYNPIANTMPEWMPGEEYFLDFRHGDPYIKVPEGELRLPGPGYAALHPEVAGLRPEEYPLAHRYRILADIAKYSDKFKEVQHGVREAIKRGELSKQDIALVKETNRQISAERKRKEFQEYRFSKQLLEPRRVSVAQVLSPGVFKTEEGETVRLAGVNLSRGTLVDENTAAGMSENVQMHRTLIADYLRQYIYPGAELDVFVHRDPVERYKTSAVTGSYIPAAIVAGGVNLGKELADKGLVTKDKESAFADIGEYGGGARWLGATWERLTHWESPLETLVPLSPMAKFFHDRTAIEDYERSRIYGSDAGFWQHPIRQFIKPALRRAFNMAGADWTPEHVKKRWEVEEYFDKLKYMKYRMLEKAAWDAGSVEQAKELGKTKGRTMFGVNPYAFKGEAFVALPNLERDYFKVFAEEANQEDRMKILSMLPPEEQKIFMAQWERRDSNILKGRVAMGIASDQQVKVLKQLRRKMDFEGKPISNKLWKQYAAEKEKGESYAEWFRKQELEQYFKRYPLPGPNWVGWHPHCDLEDIKLVVAQNTGIDIHDFNLWENRARALRRKPYIAAAAEEMGFSIGNDPEVVSRAVETGMREMYQMNNVQVTASRVPTYGDSTDIQLTDPRTDAIQKYKDNSSFMGMM